MLDKRGLCDAGNLIFLTGESLLCGRFYMLGKSKVCDAENFIYSVGKKICDARDIMCLTRVRFVMQEILYALHESFM